MPYPLVLAPRAVAALRANVATTKMEDLLNMMR